MKSRLIISVVAAAVVCILIGLVVSCSHKRSRRAGALSSAQDGMPQESADELYAKGNASMQEGKYLEAQGAYQKLVTYFPDSRYLAETRRKLDDLNIKIIFSRFEVSVKTQMYEVQRGDSLEKIAQKFGTTVMLIRRSNGIQSDIIQVGQKLRIWTQKFSCVVDKSQNTLLLKSGEDIVKTYRASTGTNNCTPVGTFKIVNKIINPVWYKEGGTAVLPENPENILGTRWLGFDLAGYGIHGTTQPETIGQQATQGCVRLTNQDVEEFYDLIPVGTEVTVVD